MSNTEYHIAQVNIGRILGAMDSEIMQGFASRLDEINALADGYEGFVWRLQTDDGDATAIRPYEDEMMIINMSTWETIDTLWDYTYKSVHAELFKSRRDWFERMTDMHMCLWWVPAGTIPTPDDAKERLAYINKHGATPYAFTFKQRFTVEELSAYRVVES